VPTKDHRIKVQPGWERERPKPTSSTAYLTARKLESNPAKAIRLWFGALMDLDGKLSPYPIDKLRPV
jgi:hypothetical protein